jgi:nucleoside-diphosphate-sugar epimerase
MYPKREFVVITGSNGLIGAALMKRLSPYFEVIGCDVGKPCCRRTNGTESVFLNLNSEESTCHAIKYIREVHATQIASVIHLAACDDFSEKECRDYELTNIQGTTRLLAELRHLAVEQIIHSSTMLVQAPCNPGERINEPSPTKPQWMHPRSSLQTENAMRGHHGSTPLVTLRIAGVYDDYCHSIPLAHQIQRIYERQFFGHLFPGRPLHSQAFIHLDDLVDVILRLVQCRNKMPAELTQMAGEPETLTYREIRQELGRLFFGNKWKTFSIPKTLANVGMWARHSVFGHDDPFLRPGMLDRVEVQHAIDTARAQRLLGWAPKQSLRETLKKMVSALEADPARWYREHGLSLSRRPKQWEVCHVS